MKRAPLVSVGAWVCPRKLEPGEVKRCMTTGPLVGYYLACPGCGFRATYLDEDVGYVEESAIEGSFFPRRLIGFTRSPTCIRCKASLRVDGRELVAA